jgi:hypothetical protein
VGDCDAEPSHPMTPGAITEHVTLTPTLSSLLVIIKSLDKSGCGAAR